MIISKFYAVGVTFCLAQDVATRAPIMVTELYPSFRESSSRSYQIDRDLKSIAISQAKSANELHWLTVG